MTKVNLPGLPPIEVVSDEEAEACDAVVCVLATDPTLFDDNVFADCAWCGVRIQHRPSVPKRPPKICMPCVVAASGDKH